VALVSGNRADVSIGNRRGTRSVDCLDVLEDDFRAAKRTRGGGAHDAQTPQASINSPDHRIGVFLLVLALACGNSVSPRDPTEVHFPGTAAVRVLPARNGDWLLLLETLQTQLLVTSPIRSAALVSANAGITNRYEAPSGWVLIDAVPHASGDVSLLSLRLDQTAEYPLRAMVSRVGTDGTVTDRELIRLVPSDGLEAPPAFVSSLDRARIVAYGEDLFAVVRWANNSVQAYRLSFDGSAVEQEWVAWVEPAASLAAVGIIGGGFDNFHQGDKEFFVYADVGTEGDLYACVSSAEDVLHEHDAFFGENLTAEADPANFDFGSGIVTRITAQGSRSPARLLGIPGRDKRLLNMRLAGDSVILVGRIRTGTSPGGWDAWILSSRAVSGDLNFERTIDVQDGDMFWDATGVGDGRLVAVGSTNYTQNPTGLSVSDARDSLALLLDSQGNVQNRIALPAGPAGRGNEAMSVFVRGSNEIAISGVENAPGTHAEVFSDAFLIRRGLNPL
jgi:hypothetical protein